MRLLFLVEVYSKRCINQLLIGSSKTRLLSNRSCKDWKCTRINRPTFEWDRAIQHPTETKRTVIWESRHLRWIPHKFPLPSPLSAFVFVFSLGCRWQFSVLFMISFYWPSPWLLFSSNVLNELDTGIREMMRYKKSKYRYDYSKISYKHLDSFESQNSRSISMSSSGRSW